MVSNERSLKFEMKESLASVLPHYLYSLIVGIIGMLEKQLQSLRNYGRARDATARKHVLYLLRAGQQDLSDRILHRMSSEEQLALAFWISSQNESLMEHRSSLEQLQQSPQILVLAFLVLKMVHNPQRQSPEEAFHPDVVLVLVSALSSTISNHEDYAHRINFQEPVVVEAFHVLEADSVFVHLDFTLLTETEGNKYLNDSTKEKLLFLKKRIDQNFVQISSFSKLRELVGGRRDHVQRHSSLDSIEEHDIESTFDIDTDFHLHSKGKLGLPKRQSHDDISGHNTEATNNAETYYKSVVVGKHIIVTRSVSEGLDIEVPVDEEKDSGHTFEDDGTSNTLTEEQCESSSFDQPASPPNSLTEAQDEIYFDQPASPSPILWCWKRKIRHFEVEHMHDFIRTSSQKSLEELDTECNETICHAIVCEFETDSAVALVRELDERSLRVFHQCDILGNTPLHNAVRTGNVLIAQELLGLCPGSLQIQNKNRSTPIDVAMHESHDEIVECLMCSAVENDPCGSSSMLQSCLLNAMKIGYTKYLKFLLQLQSKHNLAIDFECSDCDKHTAWFYLKQKDIHVQNAAREIIMSSARGPTLLGTVLSELSNRVPPLDRLPTSQTSIPPPHPPCSSSIVPQDESVVIPQCDTESPESPNSSVPTADVFSGIAVSATHATESEMDCTLQQTACDATPPVDCGSTEASECPEGGNLGDGVDMHCTFDVEEYKNTDGTNDADERLHRSSLSPCSNAHSSELESPTSNIESTVKEESKTVKPKFLPLNTVSSREQDITAKIPTPESPVSGPDCIVLGRETQQKGLAVAVKDDPIEEVHLPTHIEAVNTVSDDLECSADGIQELFQPCEKLDGSNDDDALHAYSSTSESQPSSLCSNASSLDLQPAPPDIAVTQAVTSGLECSLTEESDSSIQARCVIFHFSGSVTSSGHSTPEKRIKSGNKKQRQQAEIRMLSYRSRTSESESSENGMVYPRWKKNRIHDKEESNSNSEPGSLTDVNTEASITVSSDSELCGGIDTSDYSTSDGRTDQKDEQDHRANMIQYELGRGTWVDVKTIKVCELQVLAMPYTKQFERETKILAKLYHPNIVRQFGGITLMKEPVILTEQMTRIPRDDVLHSPLVFPSCDTTNKSVLRSHEPLQCTQELNTMTPLSKSILILDSGGQPEFIDCTPSIVQISQVLRHSAYVDVDLAHSFTRVDPVLHIKVPLCGNDNRHSSTSFCSLFHESEMISGPYKVRLSQQEMARMVKDSDGPCGVQSSQQELGRRGWGAVKITEFHRLQPPPAANHPPIIISNLNRQQFMYEMNIAAKLRHPNLVGFIGTTLKREPVILTELMTTSLGQVSLQLQQKASILLDVAQALEYLHQTCPNTIYHCDLSTTNILLYHSQHTTAVPKLSDYGSANFNQQVMTAGHGELLYAPPETLHYSSEIDIFSFGVVAVYVVLEHSPLFIQQCTDNDRASVPTEIACNFKASLNIFDKKLFKTWILTTMQNGGYNRLKYSLTEQRSLMLQQLIDVALTIKQLYLTRPNLILPCNVIPFNQGPNNILVSKLSDYSSAKFNQVATADHGKLSYAPPEAVTVSQQCSRIVSWTFDTSYWTISFFQIQRCTDNEAASVPTGIASGTFTNSFDKKHFKKWILTTIQNGGYDRLKYSVHSSWHSVFGFVPVKGKPLTRSQKKRAKVVFAVARSKKSSIPEYVLQNLRDLSTLVCRNNAIDLLDDTDDFFRGKKPKPSKKDKSKKGADGSGTVKKSPSQGSDDTGIATATTSELDVEDGMKSSRARTLGATPCSADAPVHRQKSRVNSFPRSKNGHPLSMTPEEPSRVAMSTQISEEFYQSTAETSTRVPEEIVQASRVPTESQFEKPRQEVSVENSVLNFTNSNNSLDVIQSHLTTYSKCCPRHDIQNIVVVGTTCPASDAFGPKRRYSSIKDIKQDPRHDKFNSIKSLQEKTSFIFQHSQQVMSDRLMPHSERRARETMPHLVSDTAPATNLHELHSQHRASSSTQLLTRSQGNQNIASNSKAGRDVSTELHQPKSTQHHTTPLPGVQRSSIQSVPTVSTHPHSEPGDHKDRLRCMAELLHAQDYPRLLPLSYNGRPPPSFPPKIRIPYVFIAGLAFYKMSNHKKSVEYFQQCLHLAEECYRDGDITICSIYIGDIEFAQRKYLEAADKYRTALHHYARDSVASDFRMILPTKSAVWSKCGSAFKNASRMGDAVTAYEQAIEVASSKKDRLSAHTSLGNLYQGIGENDRAVSEYEEAITLATDLKDDVSLGWNHGNLGNALLGLHQRDKALHHLYKALDMAVDFETTPQAIGRAYNNLGTAYQSLNELKKAEEHYDLALAQAIYGNDIPGQARVYGNIGNLQMLNKQFDRAVPHYTEVMRLSQDKSTITTAHHNRGCAYYDWAEKKKKDYAQRSTTSESAESNKTTFKVSLHGPNFERCEEDYRPPFVSDGIQKYYLQGTRDLEYVMRHHEENFNGIKGSPKGLSLSVSLFETNSRTFHRMQDCLVHVKKSDHQPSKFEDALLVAEQSRARTLGELLLKRRGPQLGNKLESLPSLPQLKSIVERQHHPVLYLSYTGERLLGWLLVPKFEGEELKGECTLNMFEVPLSDSEFDGKSFDYHLRYSLNEQLVERSFEMYKPFKHDKDNPDPVAKLHDLVAKPVIHMLKTLKKQQSSQEKGQKSSNSEEEKRRKVEPQKIIVIPDSYTNLLPFTCTLDRDSGKFWGDDYYFQIMPSLLTMGILDQLPKVSVAIPVEHQQMLCVVGNPTIPPFKYNNDEWNLGKLPHATKEAEWVSHILKCKPILHEQATKDAVMMRIMNAKVIHLATHGSAVAGFLAFAGMTASTTDTVDAKRVLIYPEEIESLNISPALVVLSSCDSGRGVFKADGIQGMARAFILAGAQAVLTTLWRVPDESACIFMQFFYQYLVEGVKGPEALHKSILSLRCFKKYSQYIHWSGYQLTGREFQFQVNQSSARAQLTTRLGQSSIFPQLDILKNLETAFMNNPRLPTDVQVQFISKLYILHNITFWFSHTQVLHGPPGVKPSEPMIDFIHCHHTHFTGGIFWINCRTPQLIDASIEYIKDVSF